MQIIAKMGPSGQQTSCFMKIYVFPIQNAWLLGGASGTVPVYHPPFGFKTLDNHSRVCQKPLFFIATTYNRDFDDSLLLSQCKPLPNWARLVNNSSCSIKIYAFPIQNQWLLGERLGNAMVTTPSWAPKTLDNDPCVGQKPLFDKIWQD